MIRIHQVLATLGYGDAIGHEVLGIQRTLRGAGYESDIFVEPADSRLEPLTRDYRELVDFSDPENLLLHHFSLGSKASRTAFALPDRMALIYHNITPPEYFVGVHRTLARQCFRGRRELQAYAGRCDLALGDSEFNRQDLEAFGFPRTGVLPVVPDFSHLDREPNWMVARDFDDDWTNILFVGRIIANKKIEDLIRFFYAYQTIFNPGSRLLLVGAQSGFEHYLASLHQAPASCSRSRIPSTSRRSWTRFCRMRRFRTPSSKVSSKPSRACGRRISPARCSVSSDRSCRALARRGRTSRSTSGTSSTPPRSSKRCACIGRRSTRRYLNGSNG